MEFKVCPNDDPTKTVTQECLNRHVLPLAETRSRKYYVPNKNGYQKLRIKLMLPQNIKCKACVFQWMYNAGNSWGTDKITGRGCVGCGNQEQFYGCADIAIGHDDIRISSHKTLPADEEDEERDDYDNVPDITHWHWTARPSITPEWKTSTDKQMQTFNKGSQSFSFMPVMNNNGMNPCMCICKKAPLKMKGGEKTDGIEARFFENLEGQENQVCMCMCQNSANNFSLSFMFTICAFILTRASKLVL